MRDHLRNVQRPEYAHMYNNQTCCTTLSGCSRLPNRRRCMSVIRSITSRRVFQLLASKFTFPSTVMPTFCHAPLCFNAERCIESAQACQKTFAKLRDEKKASEKMSVVGKAVKNYVGPVKIALARYGCNNRPFYQVRYLLCRCTSLRILNLDCRTTGATTTTLGGLDH